MINKTLTEANNKQQTRKNNMEDRHFIVGFEVLNKSGDVEGLVRFPLIAKSRKAAESIVRHWNPPGQIRFTLIQIGEVRE